MASAIAFVLRNIAAPDAQQIREQRFPPRHSRRQLPEKAQPRVDVRASADRRDQQPALELSGRRCRIVRLEQRYVSRIPVVREVETALLHPVAPVLRAY